MPDEFSVKLCKLVQRHPELYDIFNESFHNEEVKNNAWHEIAQDLGVQQSKCVIKWKSLKHQYVKAKKEPNTTWDLWPFLQFLDDTAAAKSAPKKRKRESTATPMKMEIPVADIEMPRASSAHDDTVGELDSTETGTPLQTVDEASTVHLDTTVASTTRGVNGASSGTPLKAGTAYSQGTAMASTTMAMQPEVVLSRIPVLSAKLIREGKPVILPAASPEKATVSDVM
ncbi:hypothetical protein HPB49_014842 [Dermacentor silvarum]|uniref:Uncharacterized protein n=1 Tax=Dermacentor silvarum TaxID=543639 RepID=A0ACB8CA41_DERSI|nr:hypothetical protein HPB49_014842 [Dermacentor silvarum]